LRTTRRRYGRVVAVCCDQAEDLNGWTVKNSWAVAYRKYAGDYAAEEGAARQNRHSIWSGNFDLRGDCGPGSMVGKLIPA
jgi:endonuclease YncB( thermonuclease family)